jgi:hypothetical protein
MENLFENFNLIWLIGCFLPVLFVGQTIFLLIVGRQISLMSNLYKTDSSPFLKGGNWLLLVLALLGLAMSLMFDI